jgi:MSHA biogenesis protein MshI
MFDVSWLQKLPGLALRRRATARTLAGLYRSTTHWVAARVRRNEHGSFIVEQIEAVPAPASQEDSAYRRLIQSTVLRDAVVVLTLSPDQYSSHTLAAPAVPDDEMVDALRWQMRATLPFAPEEAAIDYMHLSRAEPASAAANLLVFAAQRRIVNRLVEPLLAARVAVQAVDVPELAQRNLLARLPGPGSGQALLSLDPSSGLLTVLAQGELCFARRIQMPRPDDLEEEDPEHVAARVATQIQRSVEIVERQSGLPPITAIWIGPHPYSALISSVIAEHTAIDCPQLDLAAEIHFAPGIAELDAEIASSAVIAIGAAMRVDEAPAPAARQNAADPGALPRASKAAV